MPIGYAIDEARELVFVRGWGEVTDRELRLQGEALRADERFDPDARLVADFRDASVAEVTSDFLRAFRTPFGSSARRALIARDKATFGLARMYGLLQGDDSVGVFKDLDAALDWLGLPSHTELPAELDASFSSEPSRVGDLRA